MVVLDTTTLTRMEWGESASLGANDLKIAAITIVNNGTLITNNVRDFRQIKDLKFEDWTTTKATS